MEIRAIILLSIAATFLALFFDLRRHRPWLRLLIWTVNLLGIGGVAALFSFVAQLNANAHEGFGFLAQTKTLMGLPSQADIYPLPDASPFPVRLSVALLAIGILLALAMAIALLRRHPLRYTRLLLAGCILWNLFSLAAFLQNRRIAEGARRTRQYYLQCQSEITRINALPIPADQRTAFFKEALKPLRFGYESARTNYASMEQLLTALKDYPPAQ